MSRMGSIGIHRAGAGLRHSLSMNKEQPVQRVLLVLSDVECRGQEEESA
jgi:hypothetical protein